MLKRHFDRAALCVAIGKELVGKRLVDDNNLGRTAVF
jgi:hypothetical protein